MRQDSGGPGILRGALLFVRLIRAYLNDGSIGCTGKGAYGKVLRCPLLPGTAMVCYADNTLVMAGGRA
jgi:hypothetical protein